MTESTPPAIDPTILDRVRKIVASHAGSRATAQEFTDETSLWDSGLSSLAHVRVIVAVETEFEIEFPGAVSARETFGSIRAIAVAVADLLANS